MSNMKKNKGTRFALSQATIHPFDGIAIRMKANERTVYQVYLL